MAQKRRNSWRTNKKPTQAQKEACSIKTPEFRVAYPSVFEARSVGDNDEPKFSVTMLFSKKADLTVIKKALLAAKICAFGENKADWPEISSPVQDGDSRKFKDKAGYAGHYAIRAASHQDAKPGVFDQKAKEIIDSTRFYAGCYAHALVYATVWEYAGKYGVRFILDHVQKTKEGEAFGGRKSAQHAFTPLESDDEESDDFAEDDSDDFASDSGDDEDGDSISL